MSTTDDPYKTLSLPTNATPAQIKTAYRKLALQYHPDRQVTQTEKEQCSEVFVRIGDAYGILSDSHKRQDYDEQYLSKQNHQYTTRHHSHDDYEVKYEDRIPETSMEDIFESDEYFGGRNRGKRFVESEEWEEKMYILKETFADLYSDNQCGTHDSSYDINYRNHDDRYVNNGRRRRNHLQSTMMQVMNDNTNQKLNLSFATETNTINGKRKTARKKMVRKADGTEEWHVEAEEADYGGALGNICGFNFKRWMCCALP